MWLKQREQGGDEVRKIGQCGRRVVLSCGFGKDIDFYYMQ